MREGKGGKKRKKRDGVNQIGKRAREIFASEK